ncbi:phosphotriesterase [Salicibibacter halophilus]|uniref:Phosphotriesterase n=1 Tax=Salicibibacter halophilus TaxID=2502791 RepID=A0A514LF47_9BACI|nr:phosphotriesterase [Salicibibacter halophilus]QDI90477.1 phosphotriesterase [Salicibibacter halophilus]
MSEKMVETVNGPINVDAIGKTLVHEHFIFGYPGFQGDQTLAPFNEKEYLASAIEIANEMMAHGVETVVDPTPNECGRDPRFLRKVSEATGLQIICATGYYYEGEGATPYFKFRQSLGTAEDDIYEMFKHEIIEGIEGSGIKPGVIKLASSRDDITPYEGMFFRAAAKIQQETGIVLLTHTQEGTMGPEQAELLLQEGADPNRIIIGHMCGNTDPRVHRQVMDQGIKIGLDRFGLQGMVGAPYDQERIEVLLTLLDEGYEDFILLSHDKVNLWLGRPPVMPDHFMQLIENWRPTYLFDTVVPELMNRGIKEKQIEKLFTDNARTLFGDYEK